MNADLLSAYQLLDRYDLFKQRIYINGVQTFLRMAIAQRQSDRIARINSAGFITGYRGSPVGGLDLEAWRESALLQQHDVAFQPSINEDLAATALWGTHLTDHYHTTSRKQGVFGYWYGKGHGVDRSADVFRQANIQGTAKFGGALVIAGDDHNAESSVFAHQTDHIFAATFMPLLFPASIEEYVRFGLPGIALSRFSGLWVGFKAVTEIIESAGSISQPTLPRFQNPDFAKPVYGLNFDSDLQWPAQRSEYERRVLEERIPAAQAFCYDNKLDVTVATVATGGLGIVTAGKGYADLLQTLSDLGLGLADLIQAGVGVLKIGIIWPLEPRRIREYARRAKTLFVIEEKRPFLEDQVKSVLYGLSQGERPSVVGKTQSDGSRLLAASSALSSMAIAKALIAVLPPSTLREKAIAGLTALDTTAVLALRNNAELPVRAPYFCAGCPHNRSTQVPHGSVAGAGIGCHIMAVGTARRTETFTQMGGEGVHWVGLSPFNDMKHMFQNLGDGTYQHSGVLAVRQAVVSGVNLTFKILFNDAVAMTGGQPVEGQPTVSRIAQQLLAEGVREVVVVSDDPKSLLDSEHLPVGVNTHSRDALESVQTRLRQVKGVTAIIYAQTCAAEKRRRRKRDIVVDPKRRLFINDRVCEGCGDCSQQSGCIAVEPLTTAWGRKRQINQSSCNKDLSCLDGFCPSFVEVIGGELRKAPKAPSQAVLEERMTLLPTPEYVEPQRVYSLLCAGIGGSGVLTLAGIIAMAAHLQGHQVHTLDFTGLS
ncbi:MAG: indolepyruvate ferredoxin oxidoreductase family protein, partial [Pseudomonadota bacterium]|nr:indolepyruvate ferredoxin oxidoreductase family protein [Pseudomonadota bacterium]